MIITPPLPATVAHIVGNTRIVFRMSNPCSPLWLGTLTLTNDPRNPDGTIGTLAPVGTPAIPSGHTFKMGDSFPTLLGYAAGHPSLYLEIQYDQDTDIAYNCFPVVVQLTIVERISLA